MKSRIAMGAVAALLLGSTLTAADLKSGPQPGEKVSAFNPLHCTGRAAGSRNCLVWSNGPNPVVMIFAREVSPGLTSLVKKIDQANADNKSARMGSFVVFCSDEEGLEKQLKDLAAKEGIKHTVLAIDNPTGPQGYTVPKDADVTVMLYTRHTVKANHAFKKGELKDKDVEAIVKDLDKILPRK